MSAPRSVLFGALLSAAFGCKYEEVIDHKDIHGTVKIPKEALDLAFLNPETSLAENVSGDMRALGPVYLGVFPGIQEGAHTYTYPETGPVVENREGDTYPYGGTTVGRFDWGCYEAIRCQLVTGRYKSFEDVLDFYANTLHTPILNDEGVAVGPDEYRERCYEQQVYSTDHEVDFIKEGELDFKDKGDFYEAEVDILHTFFQEGMVVWGWMDSPDTSFGFDSCVVGENGQNHSYYDENYYRGTNFDDILNHASEHIGGGDWVASEIPTLSSPDDDFEVVLGFKYEGE